MKMLPDLSEKTRRDIKTLAEIASILIAVFIILYMLGITRRKP